MDPSNRGGGNAVRFNKRSRKLRSKQKKTTSRKTASFLAYLALAAILLGGFYYLLYRAHEKGLRRVRQEKIQEDFDRICAAAVLYAQECGAFPATEQGIQALLRREVAPEASGAAPGCAGTLDSLPRDPWRNLYAYRGAASADGIVLICWGADGMQGGSGESADVLRQGCRSTPLPSR
jgi:general secretion pathway protein G